jgi:hypothetical protein
VLSYSAIVSLDGYTNDEEGKFGWGGQDRLLHDAAGDLDGQDADRGNFDPEAVRTFKQHDAVSIGGPTLAAHAIRAGLVDEYQLFVTPVIVGGGTPALPAGTRASLDLVGERRFASGVVYLRYRPQV